ncbi:MAG: CHRD domain-containing protein [Verrucomicrobia subdivision 3 bacterium]|nr:CHRD domain-containing protein [Limisphaerales bacterium]
MKISIPLMLALTTWFGANAQQTISFTTFLSGTNAVPPNSLPYVGEGRFFLTGSELRYGVESQSFGTRTAEIRGPAAPGINAPVLFSLRLSNCVAPLPPPYPFGECRFGGRTNLSDLEIEYLLAGLLYISAQSEAGELRGQILPVDSDSDGVPDFRDVCPDTAPGDSVTAEGCSVEQLCPCAGPWRNHGEYVTCVKAVALNLLLEERISAEEYVEIISASAKSDCGKARR